MSERVLRAGVVGLGVGARNILRQMAASSYMQLHAGADIDPGARAWFQSVYPEARVYESAEQLAADPNVEAVWVATPNRFHAPQAILLANAGKHVAVQKPMAITLEEAEEMVAAADRNKVQLIAGNSASFASPIRMMAQIVRSGELGKLCAINVFAYHGWLLGTRVAEDLDVNQGGGVVFRAGPHQINTIRRIAGGKLRSVRGTFGQWMPERAAPGYCAAYMEFTDGTPAVAIQNAYGYFVSEEMVPWDASTDRHEREPSARAASRRALRGGTRDELAEYRDRDAGSAESARTAPRRAREWVSDMGIVIVSCERGDIRQSPNGVYVYDDDGIRELKVPNGSPWEAEQAELYNAVVHGRRPFHSGRSGLATLEVVLAIMESGRSHREVQLSHQVEMGGDDDLVEAIRPEEVAQLA